MPKRKKSLFDEEIGRRYTLGMITLLFFIFGLIIGSFLNVVVYRLQTEETLMGRSHCRGCNQQIAWYDNVPVLSFLRLRGKCRKCGDKISWQYPLMEFGVGILFALTGHFFFDVWDSLSWVHTIFYLGLFALLAVIFAYDFLTMYIPMSIVWIAIAWTVAYLGLLQWLFSVSHILISPAGVVSHILSAFGAFVFFWLMVWWSDETWMGMGDAYVAFLIGLAVGYPGVLWALTLSFGLGAIVGSVLIALGKKGRKSQIPFAPFLAAGCMIVIFALRIFPESAQAFLLQ